jgi:hypothetical protein
VLISTILPYFSLCVRAHPAVPMCAGVITVFHKLVRLVSAVARALNPLHARYPCAMAFFGHRVFITWTFMKSCSPQLYIQTALRSMPLLRRRQSALAQLDRS